MKPDFSVAITRTAIYKQVKLLASYEARERVTGEGNKVYDKLIFAVQDEPLIDGYIKTSIIDLCSSIQDIVKSYSYSVGTYTIVFNSVARRQGGAESIDDHIKEMICSSIMSAWMLYNGFAERSQFYAQVSQNETQFIRSRLFTKAAPTYPKD